MKFLICVLGLAWVPLSGFAQTAQTAQVSSERLSPFAVITEIPDTTWETLKFSFQRDSVPVWAGIITSTAVLYHYDQDLYVWAQGAGRRWNIGNEDKTKTVLQAGSIPLLRLPSDVGSSMYFLGDGWMHGTIAAGFIGYGYFANETRAWNTGLEAVHGMIVSTILSQATKHAFGRQSPNQSTEPRGKWRPFPSMNAYDTHTSAYDAFPTGHLMTATLMFTTVRENYPEYDAVLIPLQVVWSAALGFQMMNNGVHWASDYPLGMAMGWAVAKMSVKMGKHDQGALKSADASDWMFFPSVGSTGTPEIAALRYF